MEMVSQLYRKPGGLFKRSSESHMEECMLYVLGSPIPYSRITERRKNSGAILDIEKGISLQSIEAIKMWKKLTSRSWRYLVLPFQCQAAEAADTKPLFRPRQQCAQAKNGPMGQKIQPQIPTSAASHRFLISPQCGKSGFNSALNSVNYWGTLTSLLRCCKSQEPIATSLTIAMCASSA